MAFTISTTIFTNLVSDCKAGSSKAKNSYQNTEKFHMASALLSSDSHNRHKADVDLKGIGGSQPSEEELTAYRFIGSTWIFILTYMPVTNNPLFIIRRINTGLYIKNTTKD